MHTQEAPKFLLIHGAGGTRKKWRRLLQTEIGSRCVAVDLPGHGLNTEPALDSITAYAKWLGLMVNEDVIVVGHSMGGLIGIELCATNSWVRGLVLVASHTSLPVHGDILTSLYEGTFPDSLFYASYAREAAPDLLEEEARQLTDNPMRTTYMDYVACNEYRGAETLSRISVPMMAVYGEEDRLLPRDAHDNLHKSNEAIVSRTVRDAGHYIMMEKPDELASELMGFSSALECPRWSQT